MNYLNNDKSVFYSQMIKHWKTLTSGLLVGSMISILALFISYQSENAFAKVSNEIYAPTIFSILFCILILLVSFSISFNHILKKEKYNKFFFLIFNILLGMSIPNVIVRLYTWKIDSNFYKNLNNNLEFLDVVNFTALPIVILFFHILVDIFRPRNYSSKENSPDANEQISYLCYIIVKCTLIGFYLFISVHGIFILYNLFS